jgi:hypothetical protein
MVMTPKDALLQAQEALAVDWTGDQQVNAVAGVVEKLAKELSSPEPLLRTMQVLWLPDGARDRASARRVLGMLMETSGTLAQGPSALGWAKVVAWAALRIGLEKDRDVAAVVSLMRSAAEWTPAPRRYQVLISELINEARGACASPQNSSPAKFKASAAWPTQATINQTKTQPATVKLFEEWTADPGKLHESVFVLSVRDDALLKSIQAIESHLSQLASVPVVVPDSLDFLWWGQSLYSQALNKSYRELPLGQRLLWMADDMAELGSKWPSDQRIAYFVETLRRVDLEPGTSRPLREHASDIIAASGIDGHLYAPSEALMLAFDADPTALPTTFLSAQTRKGVSQEILLAELQSKLDMDLDQEVPVRQWAAWVCRERLLIRFLLEKTAT